MKFSPRRQPSFAWSKYIRFFNVRQLLRQPFVFFNSSRVHVFSSLKSPTSGNVITKKQFFLNKKKKLKKKIFV